MHRSLLASSGLVLSGLLLAALSPQTPSPAPTPTPAQAATPAPGASQAPSPAPGAQAAPGGEAVSPTFAAGVELVNVDAVVTDKKGVPVLGLTKDDFTLTEDGAPQTIVSFESISIPPPTTEALRPARPIISTNQVPVSKAGRSFILFFDDVHMTPGRARTAKTAVANFLKTGVREGDRVLLVAASGDAWWSARMEEGRDELMKLLKRLDGRRIPETGNDRISEWEAMRIQTYNDPDVMNRVQRRFNSYGVSQGTTTSQSAQVGGASGAYNDYDPQVTGKATEVYYASLSRNRITLEAMERAVNALSLAKGRKSLVLVSEGFIYDPNMQEFKTTLEACRRADVAIYFLDTRGLVGMPDYFTAEFGPAMDEQDVGAAFQEEWQESEGSESLSADSGGFTVKNSNDLNKGIQKIADEAKVYYLLGYNPTNTKKDGKFRKISVKTKNKALDVRARKGYYASLEGGKAPSKSNKPGTADPVLQAAVDSPYDLDGIPLRMTAYAMEEALLGKTKVIVASDVDIRPLVFEEKDGRLLDTLEFFLVVAHRDSGEYFRYDQKVEMKLLPATREKLAKSWYTIFRDFDLVPGEYQAKIVIRDKKTGKVGTLTHDFDVPDQGTFRTSTPLVSDVAVLPPEGEKHVAPKVPMLVRREFEPTGRIFFQFEVFGAAKDKASGMPQVLAGYDITKPDGSVAVHVEPSLIHPTSLGKVTRMVGTRFDTDPGDYQLILRVTDQISGKTLEIKEPFTLVAGG
jgi:VWFA-related protein